MNKPLILVVEDDAPIRNLITTTLKTQDYKYIAAATASEALQQATIHAPDVMLLDLGLPDLDGIEVIRRIRSWSAMPIIVISARSEDSDKIEALDSGADDYLTKPFSVEELLARLRVTVRRISMLQNAAGCSVFTNGDLQIDFAAGCATLKGQELHLTPIEYRLLCVMAKNCGKVLTHTYITHEVWGSSWDNDVASLRVFMATLRKKLESEPDSPQYIPDAYRHWIQDAEGVKKFSRKRYRQHRIIKTRKITEKYGASYPSLNFDVAKLCRDGFYPIDFAMRLLSLAFFYAK